MDTPVSIGVRSKVVVIIEFRRICRFELSKLSNTACLWVYLFRRQSSKTVLYSSKERVSNPGNTTKIKFVRTMLLRATLL